MAPGTQANTWGVLALALVVTSLLVLVAALTHRAPADPVAAAPPAPATFDWRGRPGSDEEPVEAVLVGAGATPAAGRRLTAWA